MPVGDDNPCVHHCANGGVCHLDEYLVPKCTCIGEWQGEFCELPPHCVGECSVCRMGGSINECLCDNKRIVPCLGESADALSDEQNPESASLISVLAIILGVSTLILGLFGGALYLLKWVEKQQEYETETNLSSHYRKHRIAQPFSHARLTDNVEIMLTNPMYRGDADEAPPFAHEDDKVEVKP